jgi:N6-adenosine-specific RNA methylase IME4
VKKYRVIVADPPYGFSDHLTMTPTKRGAGSNYSTLSVDDLKNLPVKNLADDDAILALWCPSSLIPEGLDIMKAWGFCFKQTHVWVKTKQEPLKLLYKELNKEFGVGGGLFPRTFIDRIVPIIKEYEANLEEDILAFGMGRLFRQTHEMVLIGTRGKIYNHLENKSQRSVHFFPATKHSTKPEHLQYMLELMFPGQNSLELFARRNISGWTCCGNECPSTLNQDIKDSLKSLMEASENENTSS